MPAKQGFDWIPLRIALEGLSYLDFPKLNIDSREEARRFLESYGYDLNDPSTQEEIWRMYFEAMSFIRGHLLEANEAIPEQFLTRNSSTEITKLLTEASKGGTEESRWICAILRIMHIISHLNNDIRMENFQYAREQIFGRFDKWIQQTSNRRWVYGEGKNAVPLVRYIKRQRKERNSVIMKLLAKPGTVVEAIYDSIGFRFVTENRWDSYRLIQQFYDTGAVCSANIYPGRSVNNVVSFDTFRDVVSPLLQDADVSEVKQEQFVKKIKELEKAERVPMTKVRNPFSSPWYRAIQFTCRQLISAPDPVRQMLSGLREELAKNPKASQILQSIPVVTREKRCFYQPFEIQILDKDSYVESISGRSRHRDYKERQRLMSRNRILRDLF